MVGKKGNEITHWHRLGERCECGHLSAPVRFYADGATQKQAEAAYLGFLKEHMPGLCEKLKPVTEPVTSNNPEEKTCDTCFKRFSGYGRECPACRKKRSRQRREAEGI